MTASGSTSTRPRRRPRLGAGTRRRPAPRPRTTSRPGRSGGDTEPRGQAASGSSAPPAVGRVPAPGKTTRMYQRIVVPLDGSALAERALEQAAGLARLTGAPLHLVQVVDVPVTAGLAAEAATLAQALADEAAAAGAYLDEARRRLTGDGAVGEAGAESFPASDAPARTARPAPALGVGASAVTTE